MGPAAVVLFVLTIAPSGQDITQPPEEGEWFNQLEDIRRSLPAQKKFNEFYVAVENAKLRDLDSCVREFEPRVQNYSSAIDTALDRCRQFVPPGSAQELEDCALDLTQPTLSDIEANLLFVKDCN